VTMVMPGEGGWSEREDAEQRAEKGEFHFVVSFAGPTFPQTTRKDRVPLISDYRF
jgi:hypothetical protein